MIRLLWWLWALCHPSCVLCQPRMGIWTFANLCSAHWHRQERSLAEHNRIHPDGHCTATCGCMTLEQFSESLGL